MPQSAPRRELGEERRLGQLVAREHRVGRGILEQDPAAELVLHVRDPRDDVIERGVGVGHRQQIVRLVTAQRCPAQMIRDHRGLELVAQRANARQVILVERIGRRDRQRHAVQRERPMFARGP